MNANIGNYLKEIVVNQQFTLKRFSEIYQTTPEHISKILGKKDLNTKILRNFEQLLGIEFTISSSVDATKTINLEEGETVYNKEINRGITYKGINKKEPSSYIKEIESLKKQIELKDEIIKSKDKIISMYEKGMN